MTYYEQLDVSEDASKMDIKKAYFKMVKQYPPERFPEEFKKYRKAYEVLIDDDARSQYDGIKNIPEEYQNHYNVALKAMEHGDFEYAIKLLKGVVKENPQLQVLNSLLGDIYLENGNSGNAIKTFENLVKQDPDNAGYQGKLAEAYTIRGFTKKALVQFEKALEIDPDNISLWKGLAEAYMNTGDILSASNVYRNGIARAQKNGLNALELHIGALLLCTHQQKFADIEQHLDVIKSEVENDSSLIDYILEIFFHDLSHSIVKKEKSTLDLVKQVVGFLYDLAPNHEGLQMAKKQLDLSNVSEKIFYDKKIPDGVLMLMKCFLDQDDSPIWQIEQAIIQQQFLVDARNPQVRKGVRYLQEHYPEAYRLHEEFYQQILDSKKRRHLEAEVDNKMRNLQKEYPFEFLEFANRVLGDEIDFDDIDDMDFDFAEESGLFQENEPYVRDEPKVGRNDPCPCGSGKKYKKCCGKNK